ncbi:putative methyltransferase-domain-containing protein [Boeremia exigua]|uniref:putative methyltransferase-domain-containing protein n=1 Tax=Boeremia exigua TaxID=749465 RepID=UPI001E8E1E9F|nr:putative methyltransferase-domain-containing protein [Boeremia exigua]KAH6633705.1 putative methyltransferase-domain-containing protein [Boeremia exigua]
MLLPTLIDLRRPAGRTLDPEDIFGSSLGGVFTDDLQNQHGDDPDTVIVYSNARHGALEFRTADIHGEEERRKMAHYLWNAGVLMAELWWVGREEERAWAVRGQRVIELGAGVGLGGVMSALAGADEVAITDYPAPPILEAIAANVKKNVQGPLQARVAVHGHLWGDTASEFAAAHAHKYTRVLAADCLWMLGEHENLAKSMRHFLADTPDARVLCIAGFHTGRAKLVPFFEEVAPQQGLEVEDIFEMDADGARRPWATERDGGREDIGERKKWLVVARLRAV